MYRCRIPAASTPSTKAKENSQPPRPQSRSPYRPAAGPTCRARCAPYRAPPAPGERVPLLCCSRPRCRQSRHYGADARSARTGFPQQRLYFFPLLQGHGVFRPILVIPSIVPLRSCRGKPRADDFEERPDLASATPSCYSGRIASGEEGLRTHPPFRSLISAVRSQSRAWTSAGRKRAKSTP